MYINTNLCKVEGLTEIRDPTITCYYLVQSVNYRDTQYQRRTISKVEIMRMNVSELISLVELGELYYEPKNVDLDNEQL